MDDKKSSFEKIGNILRTKRQEKNISIEDVSKELKIRERYLNALEQGNIDEVENEIYLIGYLKSYANWLGVDYKELVSDIKEVNENGSFKSNKKLNDPASKIGTKTRQKTFPGKFILILCLVVSLLGYFLWHKGYFKQDKTEIKLPNTQVIKDNKKVSKPFVNKTNISKNSIPPYEKFVFFARKKSKIQVLDKENKLISEHLMSQGDAFFMSKQKGFAIKVGEEKSIEAFTDDDNSSFLGTLSNYTTVDDLISKSKSISGSLR